MTRSTTALRFALAAFAAGVAPQAAPDLVAQEPGMSADSRVQDDELYTVEELDNLLAPVALYPDPILAQLFVAATYPDQIALAARYVEMYGTEDVDAQSWDVSVRSIARYAPVLNMLAERPNWATAVGRAYAMQPGDVMASVQGLRRMARAQGNLVSTDQQRVEVEREYIRIVPAQPRVIYVPVYDPYVVYYRPVNYVQVSTPYWSFGIGYPIGVWLNYDLDWDTRVVYYHGWNGYGRRHTWYHVSRPFISFNSYYVGSRYTVVVINRGISHRHVNYGGFGYYNTVHRNTGWDRPRLPGRGYGTYGPRTARAPQPDRYGVPSSGGGAYRPDKRTGGGTVPSVGGSRPGGSDGTASGGRPSRGGNGNGAGNGNGNGNGGRGNGGGNGNGNGNGNAGNGRGNGGGSTGGVIADRGDRGTARPGSSRTPANEDRVKPVRIGGNERPLYPRGEDIPSERVRGGSSDGRVAASNGNRGAGSDNGTWNARTPERGQPRTAPEGFGSGSSSRTRDADPVRAPRASSERISPASGARAERSTPRYDSPRYDAPRAERSSPRYDAPRAERSVPRTESPRYESPRSQPRSEPRSQPSVQRSAPRSEPRMSAPRASEPRASAPRGGSSGGGTVPRAPRGGGRDRG